MSSDVLKSRFAKSVLPVVAMATFLAGCQSSGDQASGGPIDFGIGDEPQAPQVAALETAPDQITDVELRAYCPRIVLRDGTSFYNTYERGQEDDPSAVIYQANIKDVTRNCDYSSGSLAMTVAAAGRVVPGPRARAGSVNMPIRVAVTQGESVLYSELFRHPVEVGAGVGATQFVFTNSQIVIPAPQQRNVTVYIGYDEGPYDTP